MDLQTKLLISYLMLFIVVFSIGGFISDKKTYLMISIPVMALLAILLGIYTFLENKKNTSKNEKKHS